MSKRRIREEVNQLSLTRYLSSVHKVDVTPDKTIQGGCDNILTAGINDSAQLRAEDTENVMTNSASEDSNEKRKNTSPEETQPTKRTSDNLTHN